MKLTLEQTNDILDVLVDCGFKVTSPKLNYYGVEEIDDIFFHEKVNEALEWSRKG